jgi:hypothetical protein
MAMKKIAILALAAFVLFSAVSCNAPSAASCAPSAASCAPSAVPRNAPSKTEAFSEKKFLKDIAPNVDCLDSCVQEMFCADVDWDDEYVAAYKSKSVYANGSGKVALLFKPSEDSKYKDYFIDPCYVSYYPVKNFKTNSDVVNYLKKFLSKEIINKWFSNNFLEYKGRLYLARGARGYGAMKCDLKSLKYVKEKGGKQYVTVNFKLFDELDHTETLEFSKINDVWIMTDEVERPNKNR